LLSAINNFMWLNVPQLCQRSGAQCQFSRLRSNERKMSFAGG